MTTESFAEAARARPKPRAIICDIDETLCTEFDKPVGEAVRIMTALDRSIEVHYVTARPDAARRLTEQFMEDHRLPGWRNLHFCPNWKSTRQHKTDVMTRLAKEYTILVSIGDADEDEQSSRAAGVPFVRITGKNIVEAWAEVAARAGVSV